MLILLQEDDQIMLECLIETLLEVIIDILVIFPEDKLTKMIKNKKRRYVELKKK